MNSAQKSRHIRQHLVIPLLIVASLAGCGDAPPDVAPAESHPSTVTAPVVAAPAVISSEAAGPQPVAGFTDESLTPEQYIDLGLPAHDRNWSGQDMAKAHEVFSALVAKNARELPLYNSDHSGPVFSRLTSPTNLELFKNDSLPLEARFPQALQYFGANGQILKLYLTAFMKQSVRDTEMIELLGSQFRGTVVMLGLVDELLPTIKKDDPIYERRMQGLEQMRRGLAEVVAGGFQTLTERDAYRGTERLRLVEHMQQTLPQIMPALPPGSRREMMIRLKKLQEDPALQDLHPALGILESKIKDAIPK